MEACIKLNALNLDKSTQLPVTPARYLRQITARSEMRLKNLIKRGLWVSVFYLVTVGCAVAHEFFVFEDLYIPRQYVLHESGEEGVMALWIEDAEIKNFLPQFTTNSSKQSKNSFLIYKTGDVEKLDNGMSEMIKGSQGKRVRDGYTGFARIYRNPSVWYLVNTNSDWKFIANCQKVGLKRQDFCNFRSHIGNYVVDYDLDGKNIALFHQYEAFIEEKFHQWDKSSQNLQAVIN